MSCYNHLAGCYDALTGDVDYVRRADFLEKLFARAELKKNGRSSSVINVNVTDDAGRDIAQYIGIGFKL